MRRAPEEPCRAEGVEIVSMMVFVAVAGVDGRWPRDGVGGREMRRELLETIFSTFHCICTRIWWINVLTAAYIHATEISIYSLAQLS